MRLTTAFRWSVVLGIVLALGPGGVAVADPGDLDSTFGGDGIVDLPQGAFKIDLAPGDGVWLAGSATSDSGDPAVRITRLRQNGHPEPAFGDAGELVWAFSDVGVNPATRVTDVAALPSGGVQIAGEWCAREVEGCYPEDARSFVARFDASGDLDLGFGGDGVIGARQDAFKLSSLGDDLSVRGCRLDGSHQNRVVVRRHLADGHRDRSFSDDGRVRVHIPGPANYRRLVACGATSDGGTILATMDGTARAQLRVVKLTGAGVFDVSYGDRGTTHVRGRKIRAESALVSADGAAWFVGKRIPSTTPPLVLGLTPEGERDTAFGGRDGLAVIDVPELTGARNGYAALRSDGSVTVTGTLPGSPDDHPYLAMLTADGEVDTTFGDGGIVTGYADRRPPSDVVIDSDDRVVTANGSVVIRFLG